MSRDSEVREAAWLIERGQSIGHVPTVWWGWDRATGVSRWTEDASEAFRFPSRAAAEIEIERRSGLPIPSHGGPFGVATKHVFLEPLAPPSRDSEVREAIEALPTWYPANEYGGATETVERAAVLAILDRSAFASEAAPTTSSRWVSTIPPTAAAGSATFIPASEAAPTPPNANLPITFIDPATGYPASEAAPVVGLSEAWAKAEAALPEGWEIAQATRVRIKGLESMQRWGAMAAPIAPKGRNWRAQHVTQFGDGATPAEALLNLAARLTQTRTLGEAE